MFAFRLARELGKSIREIYAMDAEEFGGWQQYFQAEPFGPQVEWLRMGILAALTANIHAPKGRRYKPSDFIPEFGPPKEVSADDIKRKFEFGARLHNAIVNAEQRRAGG